MLFPVSGAQLKFFRAKTRPENAVGMFGTEVGALFRLKYQPCEYANDSYMRVILIREEYFL
jgi:hypothetical protein